MPCYSPLDAYYSRCVNPTGKRSLVFNVKRAHSGVKVKVPCGQCVGCRLEHSRQWAMRCMHERQLHPFNDFITLTYDMKHLPASQSVKKKSFQKFFKRLRKWMWKHERRRIRFYGCGEYGDKSLRPHYHAIVYNSIFADKRFYKKAPCGSNLYTSETLDKIWGFGQCIIGDVTFDSAAYVARYIMKKMTGDGAAAWYEWVDDDGELHYLEPEFVTMSRKPGIGLEWFKKFGQASYNHDAIVMNGREVRPPRYYDAKYELVDPSHMLELKAKRRRKAMLGRKDNLVDRRRVREIVTIKRLEQKVRAL